MHSHIKITTYKTVLLIAPGEEQNLKEFRHVLSPWGNVGWRANTGLLKTQLVDDLGIVDERDMPMPIGELSNL